MAALLRPVSPWLFLLAGGCADDLTLPPASADAADGMPVATERTGELSETIIDASRADAWVRLDLDDPAGAAPGDLDWDLRFQRFKIASNGGVSGGGGVEVAVLAGLELDQVATAPASGWLVDQPDGPDMNGDPDTVFNLGDDTWFSYDPATHALSAKPRVYVVRTTRDGHVALQLGGYYDQAGTAGIVRLRWKRVTAPAQRTPAPPADAGSSIDAGMPDAITGASRSDAS